MQSEPARIAPTRREPIAPSHVTTQDDLDMDESSVQMLEQMEMVPIGKIEEVTRNELRS